MLTQSAPPASGHDRSVTEGSPTLYIVQYAKFASGDISGGLFSADKHYWDHMSSGDGWLRRDLTDGFTDRREQLESEFPSGYEVVMVTGNDELPTEVAHHFQSAQADADPNA